MPARDDLQRELEALRRELRQVPRVAEDSGAAMADAGSAGAARPAAAQPADDAAPGDIRTEIERVIGELRQRFDAAADDAEDLVTGHPFASVAAAFLLGVLVANVMSRAR